MNISMWSGPRNISTAMMYSFRERADTTVIDEALYGCYLTAFDDVAHPGVADVIADMDCDVDRVLTDMATAGPRQHRFFKNMAHHLEGLDLDRVLGASKNFILCRRPVDQLISLDKGMTDTPTLRDAAYAYQTMVLDWLIAAGETPIVVVASDILSNPEGVLRLLCEALTIDWDPEMLGWSAGPKPEDGVWAEHWYSAVHASTGFGAPRPPTVKLPDHLRDVYEQSLVHYERLATYALAADGS